MNIFVLLLCFLSLFALGLGDNARGPIYPELLRDFGLSGTAGSVFFALASTFGLVNNLVAAWWLPRLGPYRSLELFTALMGLGLVVIAWAPNYPLALIGCAFFGAGMGGSGIAQNLLVGVAAGPQRQRQAYSALHSMYGLASLIAPLVVNAFYRAGFDWRPVFLAISAPCFAIALVCVGGRERAGKLAAKPAGVPARPSAKGAWGPTLWVCGVFAGYVTSEILVATRLVLLARSEWGYEAVAANDLLALFFLVFLLSRLVFVFLPLPFGTINTLRFSAALGLILLSAALVWRSGPLIVAAGCAMAPFYPMAMALIQERFGRWRDAAIAWSLALNSLGVMIMHALVGWLADRAGLGIAMWVGPICLGVILLLLLRPRFPADPSQQGNATVAPIPSPSP